MALPMPGRFVYRFFQIDTNRINSRAQLQNMNRLEEWHRNGVVRLDISETAQDEAARGSAGERRKKAFGYIYTISEIQTAEEKKSWSAIEKVLFPGGAGTQAQRNDVEIVFNALKYQRILVTADGGSIRQPGGMLGNAYALAQLGVTVVSDRDAVALVERLIARRDDLALRVARATGEPLPSWVGLD